MAAKTLYAENRSLTSRLFFWAGGPWRYLQTRSRTQLLVLSASVLAVLAIAGFWSVHYLFTLRTERQVTRAWKSYDEHVKAGRLGEARNALLELQRLNPNNPRVKKRLESLETGKAELDDQPLVQALMRDHLRKAEFAAAVGEAGKLIQASPRSWEAHCVLLHDALKRKDHRDIKTHLEMMPFTGEVKEPIHPGPALYGIYLFSQLKEAERLRDVVGYVTSRVVPALLAPDMDKADAGSKLQVLQCYQQALFRLDARPDLLRFLSPALKLARTILEARSVEVPQLILLAQLQTGQLPFLEAFHSRQLLTKEQLEDLSQATRELILQILDKVLELDRGNVQAYVGKALFALQQNDDAAAMRILDEGIGHCKGHPNLMVLKAQLLRKNDPDAGLKFLERWTTDPASGRDLLREAPEDPGVLALCRLMATAALDVSRLDKALAACREALRRQPDLYWARRMEGDVCLQMGRPTEAYGALKSIRHQLSQDDKGVGLFVRALCEVGAADEAEKYLEEICKEKASAKALLSGAEALLARADEVHLDGRSEEAARLMTVAGRWAQQTLEQDSKNTRARQIYADSLRQRAETSAGTWDLPLVREAIKEYEQVLLADENNLTVVNNLVWLKLKALNAPEEAERSAEPLIRAENGSEMTPARLGTLGLLYLRLGKIEQARKVLERVVKLQTRPSYYYHLAEVYLAQNRLTEANTCLEEAGSLPRTARETLELEAVLKKQRAKQ